MLKEIVNKTKFSYLQIFLNILLIVISIIHFIFFKEETFFLFLAVVSLLDYTIIKYIDKWTKRGKEPYNKMKKKGFEKNLLLDSEYYMVLLITIFGLELVFSIYDVYLTGRFKTDRFSIILFIVITYWIEYMSYKNVTKTLKKVEEIEKERIKLK